MTKEMDVFVDSLIRASEIMLLHDRVTALERQLREMESNTCGNCRLWMTKGCGPEARGDFRSCNRVGCKQFLLKPNPFVDRVRADLLQARKKLQAAAGGEKGGDA